MAGAPIRISILANANQARQELQATEGSVKKLGAGIKIAGGAAAAGIAAIGAAAAEAASQAQDTARVSAALGANPQEQAKLGKLAGQLYADNFGESFTTVIDDIEAVRSSFRDLGTGAELKKVSEQAISFASVFETDVPRAIGVASTVVKSGLAKNATEALDLFTAASQRVPKALRENLLDAGDEYSQFFQTLGFTGEQTFAALANGSKMGEFGIDKLGDAVKEFTIRSTDMSTASVDAYNLIGLNAQTTSDAILKGGDSARTATQNVVKGLLSLKPGAQQANAAIALFGTPIEDLNVAKIPQFLKGLQNGKKGLGDFAGATDRAAKTVGDTAASKIESFKRTITQTFVEEVGNRALPVIGRLAEGGKQVADAYRSGGIDTAVSKLEKLTDTQGKLAPIVDTVVEAGEDLRRILEKVGPAGVEALSGLSPLITPLGLLGTGLGAAADLIEALPDGLLQVGIQAGAAAIILPRLVTALTTVGTQFTVATTKAIGFAGALRASGTAGQTAALGKLAGAAKQAAGIGGILALSSGLAEVSEEGTTMTGVLKGAAGGAGIGAMFGPIGALVGAGVGGGLTALVGGFKQTKEEAEKTRLELLKTEGFADAKADAAKLRDALVGVVNAYGKTSRAAVEASFVGEDGKLDANIQKLRDLGVSMDTIVSATLGQADAQKLVDRAAAANIDDLRGKAESTRAAYERIKDGATDLVTATGQVIKNGQSVPTEQVDKVKAAYEEAANALKEAEILQDTFRRRVSETGSAITSYQQQLQGLAGSLGITVKQYKQFPEKVRTQFEANGLPQTRADAVRLIRDYKGLQNFKNIRAIISAPGVDLTRKQVRDLAQTYLKNPKQIRTLVRLEGGGAAKKGAKDVKDNLNGLNNLKVTIPGVKRGVDQGVRDAKGAASRGGKEVKDNLEKPIKGARADLSKLPGSVRSGVAPAKGAASTGGSEVGGSLKSGFGSGFSGAAYLWSSQVSAAVRAAIAAGKREAQTNSPSKKTMKLGHDLSRGLEVGMEKRKPKAKGAGRSLIAAALAGIDAGSDGIGKSIDRITRLIEQQVKMKDKDKEAKREKEIIKSLGAQFKQLRKNGQQQDKNNEKLSAARDRYKSLVEDSKAYSASIREGFVSYGSVVGLGALGDSTTITSDRIVSQLKARLKAAKDYSALIQRLRKQGLNQTTIQQLLDAGVEGGLATAQALAAGGASAVAQVNSLTGEIAKAGGGLGDAMAKQFKSAGIQAAAGLVAGLEREQKRLDKAADRIGAQIARALKKALGIRSPSRVFKGIGISTMDGLALGLDETRARSLGAGVGKGVEQGFKRPTLTVGSMATSSSAQKPQINIKIEVKAGVGTSPTAVGREVAGALDAYFGAGGRSAVTWS